jgi:hypothetical protein
MKPRVALYKELAMLVLIKEKLGKVLGRTRGPKRLTELLIA